MIEFKKVSEFPRGTLYNQLVDAYACYDECFDTWNKSWMEYDNYFYDNLENIADKFCFITVVDGIAVGHISWDPRNKDYAVIGHNCILEEYKKNGYGKLQLLEAIKRIREYGFKKVVVTTNELFVSACKNYESVGFVRVCERENKDTPFSLKYIDYELILE